MMSVKVFFPFLLFFLVSFVLVNAGEIAVNPEPVEVLPAQDFEIKKDIMSLNSEKERTLKKSTIRILYFVIVRN